MRPLDDVIGRVKYGTGEIEDYFDLNDHGLAQKQAINEARLRNAQALADKLTDKAVFLDSVSVLQILEDFSKELKGM